MSQQLWQATKYTVPAAGLQVQLGRGMKFWMAVAVDVIAGQSSGTGITVSVTGSAPPQTWTVGYGAPALIIPCFGNLVTVKGTGAIIEFILDTEYVTVTPQVLTPGSVTVSGTVQAAQSGTWANQVLDANGSLLETVFSSGGVAPASGKAQFVASVNEGAASVTLNDGTTAQTLMPVGVPTTTAMLANTWYVFEFQAVKGVTYTVTGPGLVILGNKITVGA